MKKYSHTLWQGIAVLAVLLVIGLVSIYMIYRNPAITIPPSTATSMVSYSCAQGTIAAAFATSSVALALSDGRDLALPQVQSGSGIRYEKKATDGTDVTFVSKGSDAFLEENGSITYSDCLAGATTSTSGGTTFTDSSSTFSFKYAPPLTVSGGGIGYTTDWMVNATTSGLVLATVSLPQSFEASTNFQGAKLIVGTSADPNAVATCLTSGTSITINGTVYKTSEMSDAGAGNFYDTTSYRTVRDSQCYVIQYTIHTTNIGNYSPDQGITAYDKTKITNELEGVVRSFKFLHAPTIVTPAPVPTPAPAPQSYTVTNDSMNTTLHLKVGDSFLVNLGDSVNWGVTFNPANIVSLRKGVLVIRGAQGLYNAVAAGTTQLTATGSPVCDPGTACPMYARYFTMTIVVSP